MNDDDALFDATPRAPLVRGESVDVDCSWGREAGRVVSVIHKDGFALVRVRLDIGTSVEVTPGRVLRVPVPPATA